MQAIEKSALRPLERDDGITFRIGKECRVKGEIFVAGRGEIFGQVEGVIRSEGELLIGAGAVVGAQVFAQSLKIAGSVVGRIECSERLELLRGARVAGDIEAPLLRIEDSVLYEGHCRMPEEAATEMLFELTNTVSDPATQS